MIRVSDDQSGVRESGDLINWVNRRSRVNSDKEDYQR